jgi:DNA-binding NarL/FixJ family response regulator
MSQQTTKRDKALTVREWQVVGLVAQGKKNQEIAAALHLTEGTIKEYLYRVFPKVGIRNRTGLAVWWMNRAGR